MSTLSSVSVGPSSPVLPGETVTLSCSAETPLGKRIQWMNPRGELNPLNPLTFSASMRDNGLWSCMVTDGQSKSQVNVSVTVLGEFQGMLSFIILYIYTLNAFHSVELFF